MAENSSIEWTTHTFNPWRGCTKVSAGCANCYAESTSKRNLKVLGQWGPESAGGTRVVAAEAQWKLPLKWNRESEAIAEDFEAVTGHEATHNRTVTVDGIPMTYTRRPNSKRKAGCEMAISVTVELTEVTCGECGIHFAFDSSIHKRRREDGKGFFCPMGHCRAYCDSDLDKARKDLARRTHELDQARAAAAEDLKKRLAAEREAGELKAKAERVRKRIAGGVCTCCNRTFANLSRHMETKHGNAAVRKRASRR